MDQVSTLHRAIADTREYLASIPVLRGHFTVSPDEATLPRYAARRDTNHAQIRDGLRSCGFTVFDAGSVGSDLPDLIGRHGFERHGVVFTAVVDDQAFIVSIHKKEDRLGLLFGGHSLGGVPRSFHGVCSHWDVGAVFP